MNSFRSLIVVLVVVAGLLMPGCGSGYVIQGKAIRGEYSSVTFVHPDDSRLQDPGMAGVRVFLFRDPSSLGRELVATASSDARGNFILPINTFGAGWLIEQWLVHTYRPETQSVESILTLPKQGTNLKMLITLGRGVAVMPRMSDELMQQYEKFK